MEFTGQITGVAKDWKSNKWNVTFSVNEELALQQIENIQDEKLSIKAVKYREKRSRDANAMLWACIGEIASVLKIDKWEVYLRMLKLHGQYTYICVKPNAVEAMKAQWRECEVVGNVNINGTESVQMLVYFGSSTYNTKEFSDLLDGVINEMKEIGLDTPPSADMKRALEAWERKHG